MAHPIRMPDIGTTVEEFRIMRWLVAEGDAVALGDELVEIETDKAVTTLESTAGGTLLRHLVHADDVAQTGDILAYVGAPGEAIPDDAPAAAASVAPPAAVIATPVPAGKLLQVAPVVRNLAAKLGVDLTTVQGSGLGGMITREDVQRAAAPPAPPPAPSRGQAAVARAVTKSWMEIPHTCFTATIDMTAAQQARDDSKAAGTPISFNALFLRAMALALRRMPMAGARWQETGIQPLHGIHLALAVDIENELYLPVLRDVDGRTLVQLQAEITEIVAQLHQHTLPAGRLTGGCMALSNLGMYPIDAFDPIIFPGHSAMLAVGAIHPAPVVVAGELVIRPLLKATLAVDHRLMNGRLAAAFLTEIKMHIESGSVEGNR
jgi:pyruvate dehydrogenase E2 component (dihydrolipoamide acetyltransferase)